MINAAAMPFALLAAAASLCVARRRAPMPHARYRQMMMIYRVKTRRAGMPPAAMKRRRSMPGISLHERRMRARQPPGK